MRQSLAAVLDRRTASLRPTLDSLPVEILELILLFSCNLALPRASLLIGSKLSSKATLLRLFIWGFHDTWDQWFGVPTDPALFHGPQVKHPKLLLCEGDPVLQTALLALPWVDIDFILQAQQTWADTHARHRWYQHVVPGDDTEPVGHPEVGGFGHFKARACFESDYQQALRWAPFHVEGLSWGTQDVHPHTQMPVDLFTGPWNEEQMRRFFWLIRGGLRPDRKHVPLVPWELKLECLRNALIEAGPLNMLVSNCVISSWIFDDLPADVIKKELTAIDRRLKWGGDASLDRGVLRQLRGALALFLQWPEYVSN